MGERPTSDDRYLGKRRPAPGALMLLPRRPKVARESGRSGVGDWSPSSHPPRPQPVGSGPLPHAPRTGGRAWLRAQPQTPHTQARDPSPRAPSCGPHSAQSELARARAVGLVTGPQAHTTRTHSRRVAGTGRTPQGRAFGRRRAHNPGRPTPRARGAPPGRPCAAPTARKANEHKQACPLGGERPQARQGDEGTGPPPKELNRRSTGSEQETRRDTNRLERPYRRPAPEPRVVRAPHRPSGGGAHAAVARAKGNQTKPAERTDRMEWCTSRRREGTRGRDNPQHTPRGTRG